MKKIFDFLKRLTTRFREPHNDIELSFLSTLALYALIIENVIDVNRSEGESMLPTIDDYSILLVDKFLFRYRGLRKGDIIVARSIVDPDTLICKRVCGVEGDYINPLVKIPKGHIWAEGDNKDFSFDSRHHGPIPFAAVQGKVVLSLFPLKLAFPLPN